MYRILVVDDEPAAIKHICNIIAIKCPQFEVTATAEHGQEALKRMAVSYTHLGIIEVRELPAGLFQAKIVLLSKE